MRLTILEPVAAGHRMHYVRHLVREAIARGVAVQVATSNEALDHPAYSLLEKEHGDSFDRVILPHPSSFLRGNDLVRNQIRFYVVFRQFFRDLARSARPDFLFLPSLDHCDKLIGLLGSPFGDIPFGGLALALKFHFRRSGVIRPFRADDPIEEVLYRRMLRNRRFSVLFTLDELLVDDTRRALPDAAPKVHYVPEPIVGFEGNVSRSSARAMLGISADALVVLVYGVLEHRKGIDNLLAATCEENFPEHATLLLAGRQTSDVRRSLRGGRADELRSQGRLVEIDRFLTMQMQEEQAVFRAADVVWVGYREFYWMSAVMLQAGSMSLPIMAGRDGLVGWLNRRHSLGVEIDPGDHAAVACAVASLASDHALARAYGRNGAAFASRHSSEAFARAICDVVCG